jgi:hypothetical protein
MNFFFLRNSCVPVKGTSSLPIPSADVLGGTKREYVTVSVHPARLEQTTVPTQPQGNLLPPREYVTVSALARDENGTDILLPYSRPNSFREVQICSCPSPNIQHLIPYPYLNTQIAYL